MNNQPIGIFDSGVGGLTIWKEIVSVLPHESTIYAADSANTPYGAKSPEEIFQLAQKVVQFLVQHDAKVIVVACNAVTTSCINHLREVFPDISFVGTVPAIKPAAEVARRTGTKRIGVLTTERTAESDYQHQLLNEFAADCESVVVGTNELVPLIERGKIDSPVMKEILQRVLQPFQKTQVSSLVLGCTHYPFLRKQIQEIVGKDVVILDSGEAIARQVKNLLTKDNLFADPQHKPSHTFFTSGEEKYLRMVLEHEIKTMNDPQIEEIKRF